MKYVCMCEKKCEEHCVACKDCTLFSICLCCDIRHEQKDESACDVCEFAKLKEQYDQECERAKKQNYKLHADIIKRNKVKYHDDIEKGCFKRNNTKS